MGVNYGNIFFMSVRLLFLHCVRKIEGSVFDQEVEYHE